MFGGIIEVSDKCATLKFVFVNPLLDTADSINAIATPSHPKKKILLVNNRNSKFSTLSARVHKDPHCVRLAANGFFLKLIYECKLLNQCFLSQNKQICRNPLLSFKYSSGMWRGSLLKEHILFTACT